MDLQLSPKYLVQLANDINNIIWQNYTSYKEVGYYIRRWHKYDERNDWENFRIEYKEPSKIDLLSTLINIEDELLIKMAIDLGIPTPDFIPCVPKFENLLKKEYKNSHAPSLSNEYKIIGSSLLKISQQIEMIRSDKTRFHGVSSGEMFVKDSIYASFIVNSTATVGLFLENYYKSIFPKIGGDQEDDDSEDELPF